MNAVLEFGGPRPKTPIVAPRYQIKRGRAHVGVHRLLNPRCPTATGAREQAGGPLKETAPASGGDAGAVPGPSGGLGGVIAGRAHTKPARNESFLIFEPVSSFLGLIWLMPLS